MKDDKPIYYQNKDYTVRTEIADDVKRYFIKYHSVENSPEYEISLEIFALYHKEFNKPLERQQNEHRRHIEDGELEYFIASGKLTVYTVENDDNAANRLTLEAILKTCTPIQQRRFDLHYIQGYSLTEIAKMENCSVKQIWKSVKAVKEKIKNIFGEG